jgi:prolipoprotein diacylglyceryl transferase
MRQIIIDFGVLHVFGLAIPLRIYGYGLMMVLGFLSGIALGQWRAKRVGGNPDVIPVLGILALIGGVAGARIAYVIENHRDFHSLGSMLNVTSGGLIYYGGVAGATLVLLIYMRVKRLSLRRYLDILSVSLMVGLAFGRAGCFVNGCCYGGACSEDWPLATHFPMFSKPLVKVDSSPGPFSAGTEAPSPVFASQWKRGQLGPSQVDERLVNLLADPPQLHAPRYLHGALEREQLDVMLGGEPNARWEFDKLAGAPGFLGPQRWAEGLASGKAFLRGSEFWDEAAALARTRPEGIVFPEGWQYLQDRKEWLLKRFDEDHDGALAGPERQKADAYLRADLFALAAAQKSLPVKPAQLISLVNALVIAGILSGFYGLRWREGQVFALLLLLYPLTRIMEEAIRDDNPHNLAQLVFTHNQVVSMLIMLVSLSLWLVLRKLPPSVGPSCAAQVPVDASRSSRSARGRTEKPESRKGH